MNLSKGSKDFGFRMLSGWIEKYKPAFSKSDSSWDNLYCVRLVIPNDLKSLLVYRFTFASCNYSYIVETCRHFKTRIEEHIKKDNKSHIFEHLNSTTTCFDSYNSLCFKTKARGF